MPAASRSALARPQAAPWITSWFPREPHGTLRARPASIPPGYSATVNRTRQPHRTRDRGSTHALTTGRSGDIVAPFAVWVCPLRTPAQSARRPLRKTPFNCDRHAAKSSRPTSMGTDDTLPGTCLRSPNRAKQKNLVDFRSLEFRDLPRRKLNRENQTYADT
jgi:hypothetical protein